MYDIEKTVKHFESLQKRYTKEHNGQMCERVADALEALKENEKLKAQLEEYHKFDSFLYAHGYGCFEPTDKVNIDSLGYVITSVKNGIKPNIVSMSGRENREGITKYK